MVRMVSFRRGRGGMGFGRFTPRGAYTDDTNIRGGGSCEALVLAVVQAAGKPLNKREVTAEVCLRGGEWSTASIAAVLRELAKRGLVSRHRPPGGYALTLYGPPAPTT